MKPGFKTTEFWITIAVSVFGALLAAGAFGHGYYSQIIGGILTGLSSLGYGAFRSWVKKQ